ncbi:MAG: ATP-dependent DNA helicase [Lachnospiraceae bacterium]
MEKKEKIKISVRNLVEFILREGDIDNRIAGSKGREAMQLGAKIHRKIQRSMGSDYCAEVPLNIEIPCEGFCLHVEGRADGILTEDKGITIDEIKGVLCELQSIKAPVMVHLAQAKCYAYIYAKQQALDIISVQMTYCQMESEEQKKFHYNYNITELETWFYNIIRQYEIWGKFQIQWRQLRNNSIKQIEFPFSYREGQKEVVTSVYKTILRKKKLFVQAPTGVGKTVATIFPAVKAMGEDLIEKLFYLTAKTITRTVAEQAFQTLKNQQLQCKVITLTAKEKICFCQEMACNPEECPYAKGHYDRVNDAIYHLITTTNDLSRESLEIQARKYKVCPFEMALDVSLWADVVICDYNYVFDPNAHLRRFFSDGVKGNYCFLIDEAHNLVERGREMYSATLYKEDILHVKKCTAGDIKLEKSLEECNRLLLELKRECETYKIHNSVSHVVLKLMHLMSELERYLEEHETGEKREAVLQFYFDVRRFLDIHERLDEHYTIYTELEADGRFKLKLFCVNPGLNLQEFLSRGSSTIFFSATLLPIMYYKQLLSVTEDDYAIYVQSSFEQRHRLLLLGVDVSTKFSLRSESMYIRYAKYIAGITDEKNGNYIAFFPSYQFMTAVYEQFIKIETTGHIECILQEKNMEEEKRELFLEKFEESRTGSLVGFCVMGGIFAEGIDLTRERLIGAMIIGTGLPQVCWEREILKEYFEQQGKRGFDYAYLYPGLNKVLQAAGRVIRTEEDYGTICLLDERFGQRQYQDVFPREWEDLTECTIHTIGEKVRMFWDYESESK